MTAPQLVIARLEAVSAVTSLVGSRIYQGYLEQNVPLPAIRVQRISDEEPVHLRGGTVLYRTRVQVDSIADGSDPVADALAVDAAVHGDGSGSSLVGWRGDALGATVTAVLPVAVRETYDAEELRQYRVIRDVFVWWKT